MAIPQAQLDTWSNPGAGVGSRDTYATIKRALEAGRYASTNYAVRLQGSYGNDTNIRTESDVDVVIRLDATFYRDLTALTPQELAAYNAYYTGTAQYTHSDFNTHVMAALKSSFGDSVKQGHKAIKIKANGNRRSADVVVATEFRKYRKFSLATGEDYESGIAFFTDSNELIANYPEQLSVNCTAKHQATNQRFKPMVRILKNMRSKLVADGSIDAKLAPSYFLEGLLYNVPPEHFAGAYTTAVLQSLRWIISADRSKFKCANEQYSLLGDSAVHWSAANCDLFLTKVANLWDNWP